MFVALVLARVIHHQLPLTLVIAEAHPSAADAADHQALEQGRTLAGRALPAVLSCCLGAGVQRSQVVLILLPTDVPRMGVGDQGVPIFLRHRPDPGLPIGSLEDLHSTKDEGAGITRITQDLKGPAVAGRPPSQLAFVGAPAEAPREGQVVLVEVLHNGQGRTFPLVHLKEGAQGLLDLLVRVEDDVALHVVDQAHRQRHTQFASAGLVADAAVKTSTKHVQFRFTHRALEAQ